jgi:3-oxoacyl-ACP reductase-like protein
MSIFGKIMDGIFHHPAAAAAAPAPGSVAAPVAAAPAAPAAAPATPQVDVEQVLTIMANSEADGGGNWRTSIVDLLKLLGLDSSLAARNELGIELGVHAGADGSAEQNIALSKAVWAKLAANGGRVPASLRD